VEYKILVKSYEPEKWNAAGNDYEHLKALEDILNHNVAPASEKEALKDFEVKEIIPIVFGAKIFYTIILEKPEKPSAP